MQHFENRKKEGNDAFAQGRYQEAYDIYTDCLAIDPENKSLNVTLYTNRAASAIKVTLPKIISG
jgi:tetratricopeptide (TPR) repeat protein